METESVTQVTQLESDEDRTHVFTHGPRCLACSHAIHSLPPAGNCFSLSAPRLPKVGPTLPSFHPSLSTPKSKSPNQDCCEGLLHQLLVKWAMSQNCKGGKSQSLQPGKRAPSLSPQQCLLGSLPWPLFSKARLVNPQPHLALSFRKTPLLSHPSARRVKETYSDHIHGSQP